MPRHREAASRQLSAISNGILSLKLRLAAAVRAALVQYKAASYDIKLFGLALTPSIFSGIASIVLSAVFVGSIILDVYFKGSFLPVVFFDWGNMAVSDMGDTTYGIVLQDATNKLSAFAVWALFALFIIVVAASVYGIIHNASHLRQELADQRLNRKRIALEALERLAVHAVTFILWALYTWMFFTFIFVYVVAASATGAADLPQFRGIGFISVALLVLIAALHVHVVFLRLLFLRPRVFGSANYIVTQ
ncbi:MAG TPA: hypothetical protein VFT87_05160 [Candidatus Saccharimonadales bacterium]|nr:hypothetical protein [Candidatus Saccharimonadales bacterium]